METTTVPVQDEATKVSETPLRGVPKLNIDIDINVRTDRYERLAEHEGIGLEATVETLNLVLQKLNPRFRILLIKDAPNNGHNHGSKDSSTTTTTRTQA
jgi:hypothetical protein